MKMASLVILIPCAVVLIGTAVAMVSQDAQATIYNTTRHAARLQRSAVCLLIGGQ